MWSTNTMERAALHRKEDCGARDVDVPSVEIMNGIAGVKVHVTGVMSVVRWGVTPQERAGREENRPRGWGWGGNGGPFARTPPLLVRPAGEGGVGAGGALPGVPEGGAGGGGATPTSVAQNDPHVALITLTTHVCGGGEGFLVEKNFAGQKIVFANIRCYTKQRARHESPLLQPPPPV